MAIIKSLLDTDFNKLTMAQAVLHTYPAVTVKYKFACKNKKIPFLDEIKSEIDHLCSLRFTEDEITYLSSIPFLKKDFLEYLRLFQHNRRYLNAYLDKEGGVQIDIEGPWISTILYETPILAIVSEIYSKNECNCDSGNHDPEKAMKAGEEILSDKINYLTELMKTGQIPRFKFADIGTKYRYSLAWHTKIIETLKAKFRPHIFVGTSNIALAKQFKVKPIGTMTHEWLQGHQQLGTRISDSQKAAFESWAQEYRGELGIALTDVVGFQAFLKDFDLYFAKLFDGCQHDSGDSVSWCVKLIEHYDKLGIDPLSKTAVFTDGIDFEKAVELHQTFRELINVAFGLKTYLTNDMGIEPPDIVIEMVECNGQPVAKICDTENRSLCKDSEFINYLKKVYQIK